MLLTKQDYINAIEALKKTGIVSKDNKIIKAYSGKFASLGPDSSLGLLQAVALYESKPGTDPGDSGWQNNAVCKAILQLMPENKGFTLLYSYIKNKHTQKPERIQFYFDKVLVSLKMAIRLFEEK